MNATPKVGVHLSHWPPSFALSPIGENVSQPNTFFWPHGLLHFTLSHELDVKVATHYLCHF
jgi:hypothetical protein